MSVRVDTIQNTSGNNLLVNGYPRQPGRIIEYLSSPCDGSTVTVGSGTYTFENVTGPQSNAQVYIPLPGSTINYCPPQGTSKVIYQFNFAVYWQDAHAISDFKLFIDSAEVTNARHNRSGYYLEQKAVFSWTINIGGAANPAVGRLSTWTMPKVLSMQWRDYGVSDNMNVHGTYYWDGIVSTQFAMPTLTIIAIA